MLYRLAPKEIDVPDTASSRPAAGARAEPRGIGGWLLLPLMHLALNTAHTIRLFAPISNLPTWYAAAINPDLQEIGPYTPYPFAPRYVLTLSLSYVLLLCLTAACLIALRRPSALLRPLMTAFYVVNALVAAGTLLVNYRWEEAANRLSQGGGVTPMALFWPAALLAFAILWAAVWIPYFWRSRRMARMIGR
jgi:hypothetical protein